MPPDKIPVYTEQFRNDITDVVRYIAFELCNPQAAQSLKDQLQSEIETIVKLPLQLKPYFIDEASKDAYYPLYVNNFVAFFVIVGNNYEFRRFLYSKRDLKSTLC